MPRYNCFLLDASGAIRGAELIAAESDADAWQMAIELLQERPGFCNVEIWERSRRIDSENGAAPNDGSFVTHDGPSDMTFRRLNRPDDLGRRISAETRDYGERRPQLHAKSDKSGG